MKISLVYEASMPGVYFNFDQNSIFMSEMPDTKIQEFLTNLQHEKNNILFYSDYGEIYIEYDDGKCIAGTNVSLEQSLAHFKIELPKQDLIDALQQYLTREK